MKWTTYKINCSDCGVEIDVPTCSKDRVSKCKKCQKIEHNEQTKRWIRDNRDRFNENRYTKPYYYEAEKKRQELKSKYNKPDYLYDLVYDPDRVFGIVTFKIRTLNKNIRERMFVPGTIFMNKGDKTYYVVTKKWNLEQINNEYAQQFI